MSDAESIFFAALDKPSPAERDAYLDAACGGDADLRRRVERLVAAAPRVGSFLDRPADAAFTGAYTPDPNASEPPPADTLPVGTFVAGRFKLLEPIGEGGMGTVYVAEQTAPVRRKVALKLVKPGMDSRSVLARFEAERQALALMDHPNIAKVLDGGLTEQGRPFFVMEYIKGVPLTDYCDAARLSVRQRLELFAAVCQAVQHAHQKGIIHRDLKPSNVLVALYDGKPVPKVIDFGLAKAMHQPLTERSLYTGHQQILGTPLYMSPEQSELNNLDVDTRTDIYSLGVMLYELLTGTTPLDRHRFRQAAWEEMLRLIREEEPPRPSTRLSTSDALPSVAANRQTEPAKLTKVVRGDLDWIVMKALEKDRGRRYATANGFARDVERYLADEPVEASPPSAGYRLRKFVRRNKGRVVAASLVALALVGGTVGTTLGLLEARRQRAASEKRLAQVERANEILGSVFSDLDPKKAEREGRPLQAVLGERLDRATDEIEGEAIGDSLAVARMQMTLGRSQLGLGFPEKAIHLLTRARTTLSAQLGPDHHDTLTTMNGLASGYHFAGRLDLAVPLFEETVERRKAKFGKDHVDSLASMNNLAVAYRDAGRAGAAIPLMKDVLRLNTQMHGPDGAKTLLSANNLASMYVDSGRLDLALPLLEESLKLARAKLGNDHVTTLLLMNDLSDAYRDGGKLELALPLLEETFHGQKAKLGPDHPDTLTSMNNLALGYRAAGKLDLALPLYEETVNRRRAKLGADHPHTIASLNGLASGRQDAGRLDLAVPLFEEALRAATPKLGPDHPLTLTSLNNLAVAYYLAGRVDAALPAFEEALKRRRAKLSADHPDTVVTMKSLATVYQRAGRLDAAEPLFRELVGIAKGTPNVAPSQYAAALADLGSNLAARQKWAEAEPVLRECLTARETAQPDAWTTFNTKSLLGGCLLGQTKFADAEPLLLAAYEGMRQRQGAVPNAARFRLSEAAGRIVKLYEAWGKPDEAARWLDELWAWAER